MPEREFSADDLDEVLKRDFVAVVHAGVADVAPHIAWCKEHIGPDAVVSYANRRVTYDSDLLWTWFPNKGFWFKSARDAVAFRITFATSKIDG